MVRYLHSDFLKDREHYFKARRYWQNLARRTIAEPNYGEQWQPWFGIHQRGYKTLVEEGPIFSLYSKRQNKAISVEQYPPIHKTTRISAWMDTFGDSVLDPPIPFLYMSCELSTESARIASLLIRQWTKKTTRIEDMRHYIKRVLKKDKSVA